MGSYSDPASVHELAVRAVGAGAERTGPSLRALGWDISDRCEAPVMVGVMARPSVDALAGRSHAALWVDMATRCRKCSRCLRMRGRLWTARAVQEVRESARTWLVTLTLRPEEQYRALIEGSRGRRCESDAEEFEARHRWISKEITRYLKRVRKESGAKFRYLCVVEAHKSGLPHYHLLVHERVGRVKWSTLSDQWKLGFGKFNLVKSEVEEPGGKAAAYVAKYLAKSALARVRASERYGDGSETVAVVLRHNF